MSDHRYLVAVLKLGMAPRAVTFILTLLSFPFMVRAGGTAAYGVIVYVSAVVSILESVVDFGVSAAAGKGIAETRAQRPHLLLGEITRWTKLQVAVAGAGALPFFVLTYAIVERGETMGASL